MNQPLCPMANMVSGGLWLRLSAWLFVPSALGPWHFVSLCALGTDFCTFALAECAARTTSWSLRARLHCLVLRVLRAALSEVAVVM